MDDLKDRLRDGQVLSRGSEIVGEVFPCNTGDQAADRIERLEKLLGERDGGAHDHDCKALRDHGPQVCNCGHVEVAAYFATIDKELEG